MGGFSMKPTEIKNVITEILESRKEEGGIKALYFVGCGGSNGALYPAKTFMERECANIKSALINSNEFVYSTPKDLGKNVIVCLSCHKGNTPETINAAKLAKEKGAAVIILTWKEESEITPFGDYIINYTFGDNKDIAGEKITAALSRQHPRDLFDCKYMNVDSFNLVKDGFILCLLGSDKPLIESLQPNDIDQTDALENQFAGMSDIPFEYADYLSARIVLLDMVNSGLTDTDKEFFLSFEMGEPDWDKCSVGDLSKYPSVQWKLLNIDTLKKSNIKKFNQGITKLRTYLGK